MFIEGVGEVAEVVLRDVLIAERVWPILECRAHLPQVLDDRVSCNASGRLVAEQKMHARSHG
jgi:hypothetical protein